MEAPNVSRQRFVRDYSTDGMLAPASRTRASPSQERMPGPRSPQRRSSHSSYDRKHAMDRPASPDEPEDIRKLDFNLESVDEQGSYEPSISTQHTSATGSSTRLADFFGAEVFQIVLHNPTTAHQLKKFAQSRLCGENLEFLEKIDQYHHSLNQVTKTVFDIHRNFISNSAPNQVNIPEDVSIQINKNLKHLLAKIMPSMESVFLTAQHDVQRLVASDIYPRFVRYQMTSSVTRALATNKNKYAGLGDCFVLTNPNKADNPIVYASDGFVKVTGYERNEIIPRNCRFLQTRQTDRESVSRIKKSLENPAECVELLLNERKNGEPFWNLLYTAPLYDSRGKLAFFLGGQINVSTTIHNTSDILRILSYGTDEEQPKERPALAPTKSGRQSFWDSLRKPKPSKTRTPGMENDLLEDLNNLPFKQQKEAFYTAYSKYIVVNAETLLISFFSVGVAELLYPARAAAPHTLIPGQEIFKFLSQHSSGNLSREYKSRVKTAVKAGQAITLDLSLCTRRIMGFELFMTHWTPLKNDQHATEFIVLTLGSLQDARRD